ncbi:porin [Aquabacterium sp.]|uniref:porin n=1 Tax=Aquabacterium sp. TaxID=1872578 RepID=UPI0027BA69E1|nr:porin [Aquabacterium sp.]
MFAKKNLIAVAALATLAVSAQAQSSVTLYGNVDVAVGRFGAPFGESVTAVESSGLTESFFGLKGQEDLGGGLKAVFKLEAPIAVDTGAASTTNFFGKNAYVGVAGAFGAVNVGRQESLFKQEAIAFNPLGASKLSPTALAFGLQNDSWSNTVGYVSPNLGGLTISAQHSFKEATKPAGADSYNGGATAVAANYTVGALGLSAVYGDVRSTQNEAFSDERARAFLVGASYDFGVAKAFAQYGQVKFEDKATDFGKDKFFQIGAIVPVTAAGSVHVSYGQNKGDDFKDQAFTLAYNHNLSKRTGVYAGFERVKSKDDVLGSDSANTFVVGARHAF